MCLRILHVVGIMGRGGLETLLMNLYRTIDKEKIQFDFMVHSRQKGDYDNEIKALGGNIYYVPHYNGTNHFTYVKEWNSFFRTHPEYPIIHGHMRSTAAVYLKIAKKYGRITIAHSHGTASRGNHFDKLVKSILQYPIRYHADYFFACSKKAGVWLFGSKICQNRNFHILNNGIDSSKFIYSEEIRDKKRKELGIGQQFVLGHIGNFDILKNHSFLIDIFDEVCKKEPTALLLLVGGGDAALQNKIIEKVNQRKLTNKVIFLGKRNDVNELLNVFDIFLLPSLHEGFGIAAIEAQANGLKCILSDNIPREVAITDNVEFIPLKSSAVLWANKILSYKNYHERKNMQKAIQNMKYDINDVTQRLTKFYMRLQDDYVKSNM